MAFRLGSRIALAAACIVLIPLRASAAPIVISASGLWNPSAPVSTWSAPAATWSFQIVMDDHPVVLEAWDIGFRPVYASFEYRLAGAAVALQPPVIAVNTYAPLAVVFSLSTSFQLFGPVIFSGPTTAPIIHTGNYLLAAQVNTVEPYFELDSAFFQFLGGTALHIDAAPSVPEPPALMLLAGPGALCLLLRRRALALTDARRG